MTKSENFRCFAFSETWRHLGIAQTSLALLSVCTSFPCEDLLSGIFFLLFSICLFPVCSFCRFRLFNITVYQLLMNNQQVFKKKIMMMVGKQPHHKSYNDSDTQISEQTSKQFRTFICLLA